MARRIESAVINMIVQKYDPKRIIHFGSSLTKPIYNDIDLLVEVEAGASVAKPHIYSGIISQQFGEKYDLTLTSDADRFIRMLVVEKFETVYEKEKIIVKQ